uniref:Transposase n=1 Tax=Heterorhabditis bacteriophora TaxID=37862 RepID=A0A1I7X1F8_HETBA
MVLYRLKLNCALKRVSLIYWIRDQEPSFLLKFVVKESGKIVISNGWLELSCADTKATVPENLVAKL